MMASPVAVSKVAGNACPAGTVTAASYTWNFKGEADNTFQAIQDDAHQALDAADKLKNSDLPPDMAWPDASMQLDQIRDSVNDMGARLCRLQAIRKVVSPWQQAEITRITKAVVLMANNTEDAILYANGHTREMWSGPMPLYKDNLYSLAHNLTKSIDNAVSYAKVSQEYHELGPKVGRATS